MGFTMGKEQRCGGDLLHGGGGGELVQKILNRLPIKTLGQFKLVSKSWCSLIESPFFFIDDHLRTNNTFILLASHTKYSPKTVPTSYPEHSLIMISSESESVDSVSKSSSGSSDGCCVWSSCWNPHVQDDDDQLVFKVDNNNNNNNSGGGQQQQQLVFKLDSLGFPKFEDFSKSVSDLGLPEAFESVEFSKQMIGSCNGLVCLYDSILNEVSLWNPATRQFKILPRAIKIVNDDLPKHLVGFGFDVETKDYKVMLLTGFRSDSHYRPKKHSIECICRVQVYSLSTDSWRLLEGITSLPGDPFFSYSEEVVCMNNGSCCFFFAHFFHTKQQRCIAKNNRFIISFDFTKEIFTPIQLPDHHQQEKLYLSCLGDDKMALFTVCCNPPPGGDSYNPDIYELPEPPAHYSCYPESHEPARGIFYSLICGSENYNIWVLDEHVSSSSSSSVNKESWRQLHSFQIEHQRPGEWTSPSCISNDGEFILLETRNSNFLVKKMKLYNLVTKEVKKDFLSCSRVMSKAYAYKPSLVNLMVGSSQQPIEPIGNGAINL